MKMQFVLSPIPEKFSAKGGYNGRFINQKGLDGKAVIEEAIAMDYVPSYTPQQVKACAMGLLESMLAGVARDGNPRSVDGFIKVEPVLRGRFPKEDSSYDPEVNSVVVNTRLLHELKPLDTSNWSMVNATPKPDPEPTPTPTGDEPVVTSGHSSGYGDAGMIDPNADFIMEGRNLAGASVKVDWTDEGGNERTQNIPAGETEAEDESITLQQGDWLEACTTLDGAVLTFTVTTSHGSTTYQATVRA